MNARAAPLAGVVVSLALVRAGPSHALSLRSSAAEAFLGDASPGTTVVWSRAEGARLRVENTGPDRVRVELRAVSPPSEGLKDGYDPWPYLDKVRVETPRAELKPGEAAEVEVTVSVPKEAALAGRQYEADVLAVASDRSGASLTLKTRVLLSVGPPLAKAEPPDGFVDRPGFSLSPPSAALGTVVEGRAGPDPGGGTTLKIVDAGDEDLAVTVAPAREWDASVRIPEGFEPAPDPRWLRVFPGVVKVRAGAIGSARLWTSVPRQKRYAGRRFAFVAAVDAVARGKRTRRWFVLTAATSDWEEDSRTP